MQTAVQLFPADSCQEGEDGPPSLTLNLRPSSRTSSPAIHSFCPPPPARSSKACSKHAAPSIGCDGCEPR